MLIDNPDYVLLSVVAILFVGAIISVFLQSYDERKRREQEAIADRAEAAYGRGLLSRPYPRLGN